MARRDYNDIFHAQAAKWFAEYPDAQRAKCFCLITKKCDETWEDSLTGEISYVETALQILSIDFVRGTGIEEHMVQYLDTLVRQLESGSTKLPRFADPSLYGNTKFGLYDD
jgi:hypothetical protein